MDLPMNEPNERIKLLVSYSENVEVNPNVPPRRYYQSGLEMVRMANVYMDEGNLEYAYVLYMKFMTLFLEKITKHPDYGSVNAAIKAVTVAKLKEVLPKAEKLKTRLLEQYKKEYDNKLREQALKNQQKYKKLEPKKPEPTIRFPIDENSYSKVLQPISIDDVQYPDANIPSVSPKNQPSVLPAIHPSVSPAHQPSVSPNNQPSVSPAKQQLKPNPMPVPSAPSVPSFDRNSKPSSLLGPSAYSKSNALRTVVIPSRVSSSFLTLAYKNTVNNVETCAILAGKLEKDQLYITHMILPKQKGTPDSCVTMNEEELFAVQDQHNLITLGWIHTHPTQTAFLSSVDLHTHCSYQMMMPEAVAIVCAPKYDQVAILKLTTNYGLDFIANCRLTGFHPHPSDPPIFKEADHIRLDTSMVIEVIDLRI